MDRGCQSRTRGTRRSRRRVLSTPSGRSGREEALQYRQSRMRGGDARTPHLRLRHVAGRTTEVADHPATMQEAWCVRRVVQVEFAPSGCGCQHECGSRSRGARLCIMGESCPCVERRHLTQWPCRFLADAPPVPRQKAPERSPAKGWRPGPRAPAPRESCRYCAPVCLCTNSVWRSLNLPRDGASRRKSTR